MMTDQPQSFSAVVWEEGREAHISRSKLLGIRQGQRRALDGRHRRLTELGNDGVCPLVTSAGNGEW